MLGQQFQNLIELRIKGGVCFFVLHNVHVYFIYDNVFSVHKHLTLNSNTQRHRLNYCPFQI